jgi:hypothetical protein
MEAPLQAGISNYEAYEFFVVSRLRMNRISPKLTLCTLME